MFSESDVSVIMTSWLFRGVPESMLRRVLSASGYEHRSYARGETVYGRLEFERSLGIVLDGELSVTKENADGHRMIMNTLKVGDMFGAAALFNSEKEYAVELGALSDCRVILFSQRIVQRLFEREPRVAENYIRYLSDRILFLNKKLYFLTSGTAEQRLSSYLINNLSEHDENALPVSMTRLAQSLNISRASLYRAMDAMLGTGAVIKNGSLYRIGDIDKLCEFIV